MSTPITDLMVALRGEVDRIVEKKAVEDKSEELSEILLDSIHKTLREIKMGANSDEFQDLTVVNFVLTADNAGYPVDSIKSFIHELSGIKKSRR